MVAVLFRTLDVLRIYDLPAILTNGAGGTTSLSMLVINQIREGFHSASALSTIIFLIIAFTAFLFIKFGGADVDPEAAAGQEAQGPAADGRPVAVHQPRRRQRHDSGSLTWPRRPAPPPRPPRAGAPHRRSARACPPRSCTTAATAAHASGCTSGSAAIIIWGLAPFYWMMVTAFRDVGFTFDTTPWPTHVTLDNFRTAFSTERGNHFGAALVHSHHHRHRHHGGGDARRRLRVLRPGPAEVPGQVRRPRRHPRRLDVPRRRPGVAAVPDVLRLGLAHGCQLPGADHPQHLLRPPLDHLHVDGVPRRDAVGARGVGADRRLHPGPGVPQDHAAPRGARPVHHGDPRLHRQLERVPAGRSSSPRRRPRR